MVWRNNRDHIDAIASLGLGRRHFFETRVSAWNMQFFRGRQASFRIRTQRRRDQLIPVVKTRGNAMHSADECSWSAPDHAEAQPSVLALTGRFNGHQAPSFRFPSPSMLRLASVSELDFAKSSNGRSVVWMMCRAMNGAPSFAPCSLLFTQHSHSSTAHPSKSYCASFEKMARKSTCSSHSDLKQ